MEDYISVVHLSTAKEFLHAILPTSDIFDSNKNYVYRGHANADYKLTPLALRPEGIEKIQKISQMFNNGSFNSTSPSVFFAINEFQAIREFYKRADAYGMYVPPSARLRKKIHDNNDLQSFAFWNDESEWLPEDMLEAAGLAQHYGIPTRLLDWTYDPLVAAFFASRSCENADGYLCIWALCQREISIYEKVTQSWPLVFSQPHYEGNKNLAAQRGLFTHWRSSIDGLLNLQENEKNNSARVIDTRPLDDQILSFCNENFGSPPKGIFTKITLPRSETVELARLLRSLRYGPSRIFPGYNGIADELAERGKLCK